MIPEGKAVCPSCGEVHDPKAIPGVTDLIAARDETLEIRLADERRLTRRIELLKRELAQERMTSPFMPNAEEVFEYWRSKLAPRVKEFKGKRLDLTIARLKAGHSVEDLKRAIDGAAAKPFEVYGRRETSGEKQDRRTDLAYIMASEERLERCWEALETDPGEPDELQLAEAQIAALKVEVAELREEKGKPKLVDYGPLNRQAHWEELVRYAYVKGYAHGLYDMEELEIRRQADRLFREWKAGEGPLLERYTRHLRVVA